VHHLIVCLLTESRRAAIDVLLKAAGYLDCAIRHVLPQIPPEIRSNMSFFFSTREVLLAAFLLKLLLAGKLFL